MKLTLKPEEERIVTPGARAVEDLIDLPSAGLEWIPFKSYEIPKGRNDFFEHWSTLSIASEVHAEGKKFDLENAIREGNEHDLVLPSLNLTCKFLLMLYNRGEPQDLRVLKQYTEHSHIQNTYVGWRRGEVIQYHPDKILRNTLDGSWMDVIPDDISNRKGSSVCSLRELSGDIVGRDFLQRLTGLLDPGALVDVFPGEPEVWLPEKGKEREYAHGQVFIYPTNGTVAIDCIALERAVGAARYVKKVKR